MPFVRVFLTLLVLALGAGCRSKHAPELGPLTPLSTFENTPAGNFLALWTTLDREYPHFGMQALNWDQLRLQYLPRASNSTSDEALWQVCVELIRELRDPHITLTSPTFGAAFSQAPESPQLSVPAPGEAPYLLVKMGDVLYLRVFHFRGTVREAAWVSEVEEHLRHSSGLRGVVVDLRDNPGGNHRVARHLAEAFAQDRAHYLSIRNKIGPAYDAFGKAARWSLIPRKAGEERPVVVLTNRNTASAAEVFVLALRTQAHVTHAGMLTAGAFGDVEQRPLPNGWVLSLPVTLFVDHAGVSPALRGIDPEVKLETGTLSKGDQVLEAALQLLE